MTRPTSSRYVGITTSMDGLPPTDPLYATTFEDMAESRSARTMTVSDRKFAIWTLVGRLKHVVGIHTMVPLEEWDLDEGSMQYIGLICWHCQERVG